MNEIKKLKKEIAQMKKNKKKEAIQMVKQKMEEPDVQQKMRESFDTFNSKIFKQIFGR